MKDLGTFIARYFPSAKYVLSATVNPGNDAYTRFVAAERSTTDPTMVYIHTFGGRGSDYTTGDVRKFAHQLIDICDGIENNERPEVVDDQVRAAG